MMKEKISPKVLKEIKSWNSLRSDETANMVEILLDTDPEPVRREVLINEFSKDQHTPEEKFATSVARLNHYIFSKRGAEIKRQERYTIYDSDGNRGEIEDQIYLEITRGILESESPHKRELMIVLTHLKFSEQSLELNFLQEIFALYEFSESSMKDSVTYLNIMFLDKHGLEIAAEELFFIAEIDQ